MKDYIKCYSPPINIAQLGDYIFISPNDVYIYTKTLYELGREYKSILPKGEAEALEYFRWIVKYNKLSSFNKWIVNKLMKSVNH